MAQLFMKFIVAARVIDRFKFANRQIYFHAIYSRHTVWQEYNYSCFDMKCITLTRGEQDQFSLLIACMVEPNPNPGLMPKAF